MHTDTLASTPHPAIAAASSSMLDRLFGWSPDDTAPHESPRTPDEAQEMLARDWAACERLAIRMCCYWGSF